jgi:hypothetical protein
VEVGKGLLMATPVATLHVLSPSLADRTNPRTNPMPKSN